jgi:hypothetical protein
MPQKGGHSSSLAEEEDDQSSSKRRCFSQLCFNPSICDFFLSNYTLIGFNLSILFNFTPDKL